MKRLRFILVAFILALAVSASAFGHHELDGKYMTLVTSEGKVICRTAHDVVVGDRYLDSDDHLYEVFRIRGDKAYCKLVKERNKALSSVISFLTSVWNGSLFKAESQKQGPVGIYHTHSDESYAPTDGSSSQRGSGGIFKVGETLSQAFEKEGIKAIQLKTAHDPHDAMAYDRSRRTAAQLLKKGPSVLLDVHRDAVPREEYATEINGQGVTKVQLVVGRENPNFDAVNQFAKQIKKVVDKKHPGFIKGIYYGKGKYNQDLSPRMLLLEFGTNTNSRESAERAAQIFAASVKDVITGGAGNKISNRGSWRSLIWIIAALVIGVGLFMLINRGSLKDIGKEFTGALGNEVPEELTKDYQEKEDSTDGDQR
ncbi:MAG TPA: stage II sporulation protein P [Bacillota bacterium]|nr:stage II sporulation protein P [Bacillota bacterium]HPT87628.1 stage II sporulation protein P [Bacillota bacterium]